MSSHPPGAPVDGQGGATHPPTVTKVLAGPPGDAPPPDDLGPGGLRSPLIIPDVRGKHP